MGYILSWRKPILSSRFLFVRYLRLCYRYLGTSDRSYIVPLALFDIKFIGFIYYQPFQKWKIIIKIILVYKLRRVSQLCWDHPSSRSVMLPLGGWITRPKYHPEDLIRLPHKIKISSPWNLKISGMWKKTDLALQLCLKVLDHQGIITSFSCWSQTASIVEFQRQSQKPDSQHDNEDVYLSLWWSFSTLTDWASGSSAKWRLKRCIIRS